MASDEIIEGMVLEAKRTLARGLDRQTLAKVQSLISQAAEIPGRWSPSRYPDPAPEEQQARYLIRCDQDGAFALYLNVMRPGKVIPPHNHTTWACIAAVAGAEYNTLYERIDGGSGPGEAAIRALRTVVVEPGNAISLLPDDIHAVEIRGSGLIRHLHFYGRALESLTQRLTYDLERGEVNVMKLSVRTKS